MPNLDKPFMSRDLYLTAFLLTQGMTLLAAEGKPGEPNEFIMVDTDDRERLVDDWISGLGDAKLCKTYASKLRLVKSKLYGPKHQEDNARG